MDSFFIRFKNPLVLIAIVLAQVIALAVQVQRPVRGAAAASVEPGATGSGADGRRVALLRGWTVAVVTPLERVVQATSDHVKAAWFDYIDLRHARDEDQQMQATVTRLREEQAADAEDAAEGRRLEKLLAFKEQYIASTVAAQVIGTSGSERSRVVYLDKGWADGLRPDQAVMTPQGVVGKLRDVFPHTAQVLLIDDASSGAGVVLVGSGSAESESRIRGILRGTASGQVQIDNLTADSRIKVGEQVVTSGGDMVFPRGLPVGVIESIAPDPGHQPYTAITIKPAADLEQLSEVLVVTGMQSSLTPAAQADAAQAAATAEANQRAADIVADRLPSLQASPAAGASGATGASGTTGPSGTTGATGTTGAANPGLPKPVPVLHPDRFSPGSTPPAGELTPGGTTGPGSATGAGTPRQPGTPQARVTNGAEPPQVHS